MPSKSVALALLLVLMLAGFALRLHHLAVVPLRGDEAFSVEYWSRYDLSRSLTEIATIEPHPLLTYATFRGWGLLAGTGEFSMRLFPALVNLLGIPALYALGLRLGGRRLGLLAALLWTIHPYEIWYAQDARNYGIWAGLSAIALWLGYRAMQRDRRTDWLLYAAAATFASNIYYDELFTLAAFILFILMTRWGNWKLIRHAALAMALPVITPVFSFFILQGSLLTGGGYSGTASNFDISALPTFLTTLNFGTTLPHDLTLVLWSIITIILAVSLALLWRRRREGTLFLGLTAFLPLLMLSVASFKFKIFAPHYILSTVPSYILITAFLFDICFKQWRLVHAGPTPENSKGWGQKRSPLPESREGLRGKNQGIACLILLSAWLTINAYSLYNYYAVPDPIYRKSADWPTATRYLSQYVTPDDLVIQLSIDPAFGYYYHAPALDIALPSKPTQPSEEIIVRLQEFTANREAVWLVGQPYPDWPNRDVVETWMRDHLQPVLDITIARLHIQQYRPWLVTDDEIEASPLATFGAIADLMGTRVFTPPDSGGELTLWLYWRAVQTSPFPLKIFVHLEGAVNPATGSPLWTQDDQFPQDGRISTANWQSGTIHRDVYTLPMDAVTSGTYNLYIGLYDPETNQRLSVSDSDSYLLQTITIQ